MVLLNNFKNIFKIPELKNKLLITLGIIIVHRIGAYIPAIGVNVANLATHLAQSPAISGLLKYFDIVSGGALDKFGIFALGIGPYINASIIMQILSLTLPSLEALSKEGEYGRKIINQYTRYLTLIISIGYAFVSAVLLNNQNLSNPELLVQGGIGFIALFTLSLTVGSMFVMWLGEQISLFGIGNGSSMIIFSGIISRLPSGIAALVQTAQTKPLNVFILISIFILIIFSIIYLEKASRKIPVQYARRIVGQRVYGGQSSYIPFKINTSGVMPVIFAQALLNAPMFIVGLFGIKWLTEAFQPGGLMYSALEFALIIFFTYFYAAIAFNPEELADNMKKSGGFVPGIRPGKQTANYFDFILNRIGLVGAIYLGLLAIAPGILSRILGVPAFINGTSLLIMVSVALDMSAQIEAYLIEHKYEGFLSTGRIKQVN